MAEEFYTVPESPEYNAAAIRKIQDTDPVRASTIVNPVVQQMINNTHAVKKQADQTASPPLLQRKQRKLRMKRPRKHWKQRTTRHRWQTRQGQTLPML